VQRWKKECILCCRTVVWETAVCCVGWEITVQLIPLVTMQGLNLCGNKTLTISEHKILLYKLVHINSSMCANLPCLLPLCKLCLICIVIWNSRYANLLRHGVSPCVDWRFLYSGIWHIVLWQINTYLPTYAARILLAMYLQTKLPRGSKV
jgi:hypothetical protein